MMKFIYVFILFSIAHSINAQTPEAFQYSAIARGNNGLPISNSDIEVKIEIVINQITGNSIYTETHSVSTDNFGIFNLKIGLGTNATGSFSQINWSSANHFLKVSIDINNTNNFVHIGSTQLLSVPYSLHSKTAEKLIGGGSNPNTLIYLNN